MGFDIRLVAAVNVNDFLVRCLRHGTMSTGQAVTPTLAPAMDIQVGLLIALTSLNPFLRSLLFHSRHTHPSSLGTLFVSSLQWLYSYVRTKAHTKLGNSVTLFNRVKTQ